MNNITVTNCKIFSLTNGIAGCVGVVSVILNNAIMLTGMKLIKREDETFFIQYPRNSGNKQKKAFYFPINSEVSNIILSAVIEKYKEINQ